MRTVCGTILAAAVAFSAATPRRGSLLCKATIKMKTTVAAIALAAANCALAAESRPVDASAAKDECPHWISVMPLVEDDVEAIASDAVAQGEETIVDGIAWIASVHPQGNPAADLASQYAAVYRKVEPMVRSRSRMKQGILLQSTMGHGGYPGEASAYQVSVKPDGKSVYRMCPLDPRFLDYIARTCRTFAALKPDFFMVDDDTRFDWDGVLGCFCPLHLAALEKATGREWTREEAAKRVSTGDAEFLKTWEKIYFDTMAGLFKTIRSNFPPETPGMLCTVGSPSHFKYAKTFAEMLAAPGQVPVVRGSGANYCGNNVYHCIERRSAYARQLKDIGEGVVYLQEADTCPQQLWACSATREYETMVLLALEGVKGAKIWITRTGMTRERRSQFAYRRILSENRGILKWAAQADFRQGGVVVPNIGAGDRRGWLGFAERYLALTGIPYRYGEAKKGEVTALCASMLTRMSRAEIERVLSGPVLIDGSGANWLAANGYADLIGADAKPWARKTIQVHLDENGVSLGGMRVDRALADLTSLRPGAEILSRLYNVPSRGATPCYEAPGSIAFSNAQGGRVIVLAQPVRESMPAYFNQTLFSESYQAWIVRLFERLGGRLPARFAGAGPVLCEVGRTTADGDVFVLDPLDIDDLFEPEMEFARVPARIERLRGDGTWRPVDFTVEQSGYVRMQDTVRAKNPAIYRYAMETSRGNIKWCAK